MIQRTTRALVDSDWSLKSASRSCLAYSINDVFNDQTGAGKGGDDLQRLYGQF